jgi:hypothetical protein
MSWSSFNLPICFNLSMSHIFMSPSWPLLSRKSPVLCSSLMRLLIISVCASTDLSYYNPGREYTSMYLEAPRKHSFLSVWMTITTTGSGNFNPLIYSPFWSSHTLTVLSSLEERICMGSMNSRALMTSVWPFINIYYILSYP